MDERRNIPRREFVEQYFPYIRSMVIKMGRNLPPDMEFNDLLSSAVIGLITSIDRYDPKKNDSFIAFARERIRGSIIDAFRKNDKLTRPSRKLLKDYDQAHIVLANKSEKEPDHNEVIDTMNLTKKQQDVLNSLITVDNSLEFHEFDNLLTQTDNILDKINTKQIIRIELPKAIEHLKGKEKDVIVSYFYHDKPLKKIGEELNVTESRVSQLKSSGLKRLKAKLKVIKEEL